MKKWGFRILVVVVVIIMGLILLIELNKDELVGAAVEEANQSINGDITYGATGVSFLRSFPDLRITLKDVRITSDMLEEDQLLMDAASFSIDIGLLSIIKRSGAIVVNSLSLDQANVQLISDEKGAVNYDIFIASDTEESSPIDFNINKFTVNNSQISSVDRKVGMKLNYDLNKMQGNVNYEAGYTRIKSDLEGHALVDYGRILPSYRVDLDARSDIQISPDFDSIFIHNLNIDLNDLPISVQGTLSMTEAKYAYQMDFSSPASEVKRLVSLIPHYYKNKYGNLVSDGTFSLNGSISGNSDDSFPLYTVNLKAQNGSMSHPSLSKSIDRLSFQLEAVNNVPAQSYSRIMVEDLSIESGDSHIRGMIHLSALKENQEAAVQMDVAVDLSDAADILFTDESTQLGGTIKGKISGAARSDGNNTLTMTEHKQFGTDLSISNLVYRDGTNAILVGEGSLKGDNDNISYLFKQVNYQDAFNASIEGNLDHPIKLILDRSALVAGNLIVNASKIDFNKLASADTAIMTPILLPSTNITFRMSAGEILRSSYTFKDVNIQGTLRDKGTNSTFTVGDFNGSTMEGTANLDDVLAYSINNDTLRGRVTVKSPEFNLDEWMQTEDTATDDFQKDDLIPANMDLDIEYVSDQIKFKNFEISKSLGQLAIRNRQLTFRNDGEIFGGKVALGGTFDTDNPDGYNLGLKLELKELGFQETANKTRIFTKLLPIARFIEGRYTATLNWQSELSTSYIPNLNTLSAYGEIETKDGSINGLLPIDTLIRKFINFGSERAIEISDTKKRFIIENGKVLVKKIEVKKEDILFTFSGAHSFNQDLDYQVLIDIPRSKLKTNSVIDFVQDHIKFSDKLRSYSEDVQVQIVVYMGGTLIKPKFSIQKINLKSGSVVENIEDRAKATITAMRDSLTRVIKDTLATIKSGVESKVAQTKKEIESRADSLKTVVTGKIDSTKKNVESTLKKEKTDLSNQGVKLLDSIKAGNTDSLKYSIEEIFGKKQGQLDSLRIKIPTTIFGKKKKKSGS